MQTILVASGTANTGSKVVELLSQSGKANVRALVRNPDSDAAKALAALPRVTLVKGDFNDPASLKPALEGVQRAFLVSSPGEDAQYDREVNFIAAAAEAGLEATVRISTANALISLDTTCVYARAHARVEKYVDEHKSRVIDLQPNWFMSNLLWQAGEAKASGKISYPLDAQQKASYKFAAIHPRDVAGAAVAILLAPKEKVEELLAVRMLEVHGPETATFDEHLAAISAAAGKKVEWNLVTPQAWTDMMTGGGMSPVMAGSFRDTILVCSGSKESPRPFITQTTPALLSVYTPKLTIADWAKESAAAFA